MTSEQERTDYLRGYYGQWAQADPTAAAEHARSNLSPGAALSESLTATAHQWGVQDARAAWQWVETGVAGPLKMELQTAILKGWSQRDPAAAASWLAGSGLTAQPFFDTVSAAYAAAQPLAAAAWARSLPDAKSRATAEVGAAREIAAASPSKAAEIFAPEITAPATTTPGKTTPEETLNVTTAITDLWATTDPAAAAKWVGSLPAGPGRAEAAATLATVWAASDIQAAVQWSATIPDAATRQNVIEHLGTTWGAIEPDKALEWLATLPAADAARGTQGALHSWAVTDPEGLGEWLGQSPAGPNTDTARLALGDVLTDTDIAQSMDLALGISQPVARDAALARFYHQWRKSDADSATEWLNTQWPQLPASAQQRLTNEGVRAVTPQ